MPASLRLTTVNQPIEPAKRVLSLCLVQNQSKTEKVLTKAWNGYMVSYISNELNNIYREKRFERK